MFCKGCRQEKVDLKENRKGTQGQCGVLWLLSTSVVILAGGEKKQCLKSLAMSLLLFYFFVVVAFSEGFSVLQHRYSVIRIRT